MSKGAKFAFRSGHTGYQPVYSRPRNYKSADDYDNTTKAVAGCIVIIGFIIIAIVIAGFSVAVFHSIIKGSV